MIAPVCCWQKDGKRICRERGYQIPKAWPGFDNQTLDTTKPHGVNKLKEIFQTAIPSAMRECCKNKKCDCKECFVKFVCHKDGPIGLAPVVGTGAIGLPAKPPCRKVWTWNCSSSSWTDQNTEHQYGWGLNENGQLIGPSRSQAPPSR